MTNYAVELIKLQLDFLDCLTSVDKTRASRLVSPGFFNLVWSETLRRGKKLEKWEQEYYRKNKARVDLKTRYSAEELAEQERLKKLLLQGE